MPEADQVVLGRRRERRVVGLVRVDGQHEHVGVAKHLDVLERPLGERQVGEREVELAVLDPIEEVHVGRRPRRARPRREATTR